MRYWMQMKKLWLINFFLHLIYHLTKSLLVSEQTFTEKLHEKTGKGLYSEEKVLAFQEWTGHQLITMVENIDPFAEHVMDARKELDVVTQRYRHNRQP